MNSGWAWVLGRASTSSPRQAPLDRLGAYGAYGAYGAEPGKNWVQDLWDWVGGSRSSGAASAENEKVETSSARSSAVKFRVKNISAEKTKIVPSNKRRPRRAADSKDGII